jgi:hypothetical protein
MEKAQTINVWAFSFSEREPKVIEESGVVIRRAKQASSFLLALTACRQ